MGLNKFSEIVNVPKSKIKSENSYSNFSPKFMSDNAVQSCLSGENLHLADSMNPTQLPVS